MSSEELTKSLKGGEAQALQEELGRSSGSGRKSKTGSPHKDAKRSTQVGVGNKRGSLEEYSLVIGDGTLKTSKSSKVELGSSSEQPPARGSSMSDANATIKNSQATIKLAMLDEEEQVLTQSAPPALIERVSLSRGVTAGSDATPKRSTNATADVSTPGVRKSGSKNMHITGSVNGSMKKSRDSAASSDAGMKKKLDSAKNPSLKQSSQGSQGEHIIRQSNVGSGRQPISMNDSIDTRGAKIEDDDDDKPGSQEKFISTKYYFQDQYVVQEQPTSAASNEVMAKAAEEALNTSMRHAPVPGADKKSTMHGSASGVGMTKASMNSSNPSIANKITVSAQNRSLVAPQNFLEFPRSPKNEPESLRERNQLKPKAAPPEEFDFEPDEQVGRKIMAEVMKKYTRENWELRREQAAAAAAEREAAGLEPDPDADQVPEEFVEPDPTNFSPQVYHALAYNLKEFQPIHRVCINPLCRRKWKQLTARMWPCFCPACRKGLETIARSRYSRLLDSNKRDILELVYLLWYNSYAELCSKVPGAYFDSGDRLETDSFFSRGNSIPEEIIAAEQRYFADFFYQNFPNVEVEQCKNWNSMLVRKRYVRGQVSTKSDFLCTLILHKEINADGSTVDPNQQRDPMQTPLDSTFYYFDLKNQFEVGEQVEFLAFPNPVAAERDCMERIVKIITQDENEDPEARQKRAQVSEQKIARQVGYMEEARLAKLAKKGKNQKGFSKGGYGKDYGGFSKGAAKGYGTVDPKGKGKGKKGKDGKDGKGKGKDRWNDNGYGNRWEEDSHNPNAAGSAPFTANRASDNYEEDQNAANPFAGLTDLAGWAENPLDMLAQSRGASAPRFQALAPVMPSPHQKGRKPGGKGQHSFGQFANPTPAVAPMNMPFDFQPSPYFPSPTPYHATYRVPQSPFMQYFGQ